MNLQEQFLAQQNSPHTSQTYAFGLRRFEAFLRHSPETATIEEVVRWKIDLAQSGLSPRSAWTYWTAARSFMSWLVDREVITKSPFARIKQPRTIRQAEPFVPTNEQVQQLFNAIDWNIWNGARDFAILHVLASGLRISEVAGLGLDDFWSEPPHHFLTIVGKGLIERTIPLTDAVSSTIQNWIDNRPIPDASSLFTDYGGETLTRRQVQCVVERVARHSGVAVHAHSLRHSMGTRLVRAGANIFAVQRLLGHASLETTRLYIRTDRSDMIEAVALDPLK